MSRSIRVFALTLLALPLAARAQAPAQTRSPLVVTVENRTASADARNGAARRDSTARPGDVLHYRLTFTNLTDRPVRRVEMKNPIPAGLHLVAGSPRASRPDARPEFSVDGGRSFSAEPKETVVIDGRQEQRPIPAERYTTVRWIVDGPVAPRAIVTAEFDARLGAVPAPARDSTARSSSPRSGQ